MNSLPQENPVPPAGGAPKTRNLGWLIGTTITVFWLVMMFTLVRQHVLPQRRAEALAARAVDPARLTEHWEDIEEYMLVTFGGLRVGAAATTVRRIGDPAAPEYRADLRVGLEPLVMGLRQSLAIRAAAELDRLFTLRRFRIRLDFTDMQIIVTGFADDDYLLLESERDGRKTRRKIPLRGPVSLLEAVRPAAVRSIEIRPGASLAVPVVDPVLSMQAGTLEITVVRKEPIQTADAGRVEEAYRVEARLNDFVATSWVDSSGTVLRRQLAGGFMLDRTTSATARSLLSDLMKDDMPIPSLNPAAFAAITPDDALSLGNPKDAPLGILGSFGE
ncbi:MAG: hypothetical protein N2111_05410 [Candidatus Sumerlaeaceae bacterium]|nr:hypothetical protein [Candidatus Sumerlaeaceae bacterium]